MGKTICLDVEVSTVAVFDMISDEDIKQEYLRRVLGNKGIDEVKTVCYEIENEFNTHQVKEIWDCIENSYHKDVFERL